MKTRLAALCLVLLSCHHNQNNPQNNQQEVPVKIVAELLSYQETKERIQKERLKLKQGYQQANDIKKKAIILTEAKNSLLKIISDDLYVYWQGTPWDFNGTTTTPKEGAIACGYFVTGLLKDAGYSLNRIKLSTCPSLTMMQKLTSPSSVKNLSHLTYGTFETWIKSNGQGLYIVGLDFHTGFIISDEAGTWFLHSNYINKKGVMKERLSESAALQASKTRYLTSLTGDDRFLKTWLLH